MTIVVDLNAQQRQEVLDYNMQQREAIANAAQVGAIPSDQFVYFAAFDGTNNDRDHVGRSGVSLSTNVAKLADQAESQKEASSNPNFFVGYFPGVQQTLNPFTWLLSSVTQQAIAVARQAYDDFAARASSWLSGHRGGSVAIALTSFSRGDAAAAIFSQMLYQKGLVDPDSKKVLIAPGQVGVSAGVLFDPVTTGISGNLAFAPNVKNILAIQAENEYRQLFMGADYSNQPEITTKGMRGNHADIGGGYDNGIAALSLEAATGFFKISGLPIADVETSRQFRSNEIAIHDESINPAGEQIWTAYGSFDSNSQRLYVNVGTPATTTISGGSASQAFTLYNGNALTIITPSVTAPESSNSEKVQEDFNRSVFGGRTQSIANYFAPGSTRYAEQKADEVITNLSFFGVQTINALVFVPNDNLNIDIDKAPTTTLSVIGVGTVSLETLASASINVASNSNGKVQLTGTGVNTGAAFNWADLSGTQYRFTPSVRGSSTGVLAISEGLLGANSGDKILIQKFELGRAQTANGYFGIRLGAEEIAMEAFDSKPSNPFDSPSFDPDTTALVSAEIKDGQTGTYTLFLPYGASQGGQQIELKLSGANVDQIAVIFDGASVTDSNGEFRLTVPAGHAEVSFALQAPDLLGKSGALAVEATLLDASGNAMNKTHLEAVLQLKHQDLGAFAAVLNATTEDESLTTRFVDATTHQQNDPGQKRTRLSGTAQADIGLGFHNSGQVDLGSGNDFFIESPDANASSDIFTEADRIDAGAGNDVVSGRLGSQVKGGDGDDFVEANYVVDIRGSEFSNETRAAYRDIAAAVTVRDLGDGPALMADGSLDFQFKLGFGDQAVSGASAHFVGGGSPMDYMLTPNADGTAELVYTKTSFTPLHMHLEFALGQNLDNADAQNIDGGAGNDHLFGAKGDDLINGGSGDDRIGGYAGDDTLFGAAGNDQIIAGSGDDYVDGSSGDDKLYGESGGDELLGGDGNDVLSGDNEGGDFLSQGDDFLDGGAGNDVLVGAGGKDSLFGGDGNDQLFGDSDGTLVALHGDDYLNGEAGNDFLRGYGGNDTLFGGEGNDQLLGDAGSDYLEGESGEDFVFGGDGNDQIVGGNGADQLSGDAGDDVLDGEAGDDFVFGGSGNDSVFGGAGNDQLQGSDGDDELDGGVGNDTVFGETGNDTLVGGAGNDFLDGGDGDDTYVFDIGDGADTIRDTQGSSTIQFGAGISLADLSLSQALSLDGKEVLVVQYGSGDTVAVLDGLKGINEHYRFVDGTTLTGQELIDQATKPRFQLQGTAGSDFLLGGLSDDTLQGGIDNDTLYGGLGDDTYVFNLGDGFDTIVDDKGTNVVQFGLGVAPSDLNAFAFPNFQAAGYSLSIFYGAGRDGINIRNGVNGNIAEYRFADGTVLTHADLMARIPNDFIDLTGTEGNDTLVGTAGINTLSGRGGDDVLNGLGGNDVLFGDAGNDQLLGGAGHDRLFGGDGDDTLAGGSGNDRLNGAAGDDTYLVNLNDGVDTISDLEGANTLRFGAGIDISQLSASMANGADGKDYLVVRAGGTDTTVLVEGGIGGGIDSYAFADGAVLSRAEFIDTALSEALSLRATGNSPVNFAGSRFDDFLAGGAAGDVLSGGRGNDILIGYEGDDSLFGGEGNDTLAGAEGNDALDGGEGDDLYIFGSGTGYDTINDAAGANTLRMLPGTELSDLNRARAGDDLMLTFKNSPEGVTIRNYYNGAPQDWTIQDSSGTSQPLADFLAGITQAQRAQSLAEWQSVYRNRVAAFLQSALLQAGYSRGGDGVYTRHDHSESSVSTITTATTIDRSISEASAVQNSDAPFISRNTAARQDTDTSSTTITSTQAPNHLGNGATQVSAGMAAGSGHIVDINTIAAGGASGFSSSIGDLVVPIHGGSTVRDPLTGQMTQEITGWYVYPQESDPASFPPQTFTRFEIVGQSHTIFTTEEIIAGASDNQIGIPYSNSGFSLIDAGAGNDTLTVDEFFDTRFFVPGGIPIDGTYFPGTLMYGNDGDDMLDGGAYNDILIGGAGNDFLDGGASRDTYVVFDGDGNDFIRDSGQSFDTDIGALQYFAGTVVPGPVQTDEAHLPTAVQRSDLRFAWDDRLVNTGFHDNQKHGFGDFERREAQQLYAVLTISWGTTDSVSILMPHGDEPQGAGIEQVVLGDGSVLTRADLLAAAPHSLDPQLAGNVLTVTGGTVFGDAGDDTISGAGALMGGEGDDTLIADDSGASLIGGKGADTFIGGASNDLLGEESGIEFFGAANSYRGGAGDDMMFGTIGADTIYYNLGDGTDSFDDYYSFLNRGGQPWFDHYVDVAYGGPVFGNDPSLKYYDYTGIETNSIYDPSARVYRGQDQIVFGAGITPDMISLALGSLFIRVGNDGQGIHIDGFDPADPYKPGPLGSLQFADGATLSYSQLIDRGFDINGTDFDDGLSGTAAVDRIQGLAGNDFLDGGRGNDLLAGGEGSDTYNFGSGCGQDRIVEVSSTMDQDTLQVSAPWNSVNVSRVGDDIVIGMRGTSDSISMNWFGDPTARIEAVAFSDGTVWDAAMLESRIDAFVNVAPIVAIPIEDQQATEGAPVTLAVPAGTFHDTDPGDILVLAASQADGSPLPRWLSFDPVTGVLSGTPANNDVGALSVRLTATDRSGSSVSDSFNLEVANINTAPIATAPVADQSATQGQSFSLKLPADTFTDADRGSGFTLAVRRADGSSLPHWLSFDSVTRVFSGTPGNQDVGRLAVQLVAIDNEGAVGSDTFEMDVADVNDAPLLMQPVADQSATAGSPLSFSLSAVTFVDIDAGDALALSATRGDGSALPAWLTFNPVDRSFKGIPGNADGGTLDVRVTATDRAGAFASSQFGIAIAGGAVNHAPVAHDDAGASTEDGGAVTLAGAALLANDTDEDAGDTKHVVSARNSAAGARVSLANGDVVYDIGGLFQNLGQGTTATDTFTYTMADSTGATSSATVTMTIAGANDIPMATNPIPDQDAAAGSAFTFTFAADAFTDIDQGDVLSYSAKLADGTALPWWLSFNAATRTFAGTPPRGRDSQAFHLRVTAADTLNATAFDDFALNVAGNPADTGGQLIVGTPGNDVLIGTAFDDVIDGREGFDRMSGGQGDDIYFVDKTDEVIENPNGGYDTVYASADYTLPDNVEELQLLGSADLKGTGNALDNVMVGNAGDNALTGGAGADTYVYTLRGGADVIDDRGSANQTDTLKLQGMGASTVRVNRKNNDLVVDFPGRDGKVTIKNWFAGSASRVERFQFDDGTVWDESQIRSRVGRPVGAVPDPGPGGTDDRGHGRGHDDDDGADRRHGDDRHDSRDRDEAKPRNESDEAILRRLKQPVSFSFEQITRALGQSGPTFTAAEIARRWAMVRGYTDEEHEGNGKHNPGVLFPSLKDLGLSAAAAPSNCKFGFEGSTGGSRDPAELKCFQGLSDGFAKL
jgi:VCBS repeat-containing protein